jgi:hypothetical protein
MKNLSCTDKNACIFYFIKLIKLIMLFLNFSVVGGVEHSLTLITQTVEESVFNLLIH